MASVLVAVIISGFTSQNSMSISGAWKIVEVQTIKPNVSITSTFPKESQAIFLNNFYSFSWTGHQPTSRVWQLPDTEKIKRFNESIINSGTYEIKDSVLTTKATFALNPMFTGGEAKFRCSYAGDTLILRGLSVFSSDQVANPLYANGMYSVSKLVRVQNK
jgi:hypothetical protein